MEEKDWTWADLVMITGMFVQHDGMLTLIKEAKSRGKKTVVGGPYATATPDVVLEAGCDFLVIGEAERCIADLIEALDKGDSKGIFQSDQKPDMSLSPLPRYDLVKLNDYVVASVQTSRGCPYKCEFCDIINLFGRKPRYKSPAQVISELELRKSLGWHGQVLICDDNFIGSKKHARAILSELNSWLESHGKPFHFMTQVSVDLGQDLELIDRMTEANFSEVFTGIEFLDESSLTIAKKHQNLRNPLAESVDNINRNGLSVMGSLSLDLMEKKAARTNASVLLLKARIYRL